MPIWCWWMSVLYVAHFEAKNRASVCTIFGDMNVRASFEMAFGSS